MRRVSTTVPAPADLGIDVVGVPEGSDVTLELRLESVLDGVLVTGTARTRVAGECARCLDPLERELEADFQELYAYPDESAGRRAAPRDDESDLLELDGVLLDLEPVLRDAVVLALPLKPLCREDCPGTVPAVRGAPRRRPGARARGGRPSLGGAARPHDRRQHDPERHDPERHDPEDRQR
jgi:uncharacterized protein